MRVKTKMRQAGALSLLFVLATVLALSAVGCADLAKKVIDEVEQNNSLPITLEATRPDGGTPTPSDMEDARRIIERRANALGSGVASVQIQNSTQILVQMPGAIDQASALQTISQTGLLEFVNIATVTDERFLQTASTSNYLSAADLNEMIAFGSITVSQVDVNPVNGRVPTGLYLQVSSASGTDATLNLSTTHYAPLTLTPGTYTPIFTGADITEVTVANQSAASNYYTVNITLNATATTKWATVTQQLTPSHGTVAIVLDGIVQSMPSVMTPITNGNTAITGNYDLAEARSLQMILESGSLPFTLRVTGS